MAGKEKEGEWVELKVANEDDAFRLIEQALNKELGHQPYKLVFDNWPILTIKLEGDGYDSTITSDMAAALVELQHAINRSYARILHDSSNSRTLTADERHELRFKAKIESGSSIIEVNLGEWAEKLSTSLVGKMNPAAIVMTVIGCAVVAGGTISYKDHLQHRSEDKKIEVEMQERVALSKEETRRHEILAKAVTAQPALGYVRENFDVARTEILKGVGDAETLTVAGIQLENSEAHSIARSKRTEARQLQLNGNYEIEQVNWQQEDEVRIKVKGLDKGGRVFVASLTDQSIERDQVKLLQEAEWSRSAIYLSINATELRGEITTAAIVGVTPKPAAKK
jgi:hypothetical protein